MRLSQKHLTNEAILKLWPGNKGLRYGEVRSHMETGVDGHRTNNRITAFAKVASTPSAEVAMCLSHHQRLSGITRWMERDISSTRQLRPLNLRPLMQSLYDDIINQPNRDSSLTKTAVFAR